MIAPAPSLSLCWQKPSPLFINLSPLLPFCCRSAPHLGTSVPPTPRFLHASQSVIGYYRRALLSSLSSVVIPKDMCGIAIRRVLCLEWALPEGGIISPAQGHQTHTHTHIEGHARGKCHRGGSHSAGKSFPLSFCLPSLPLYIIEKATQQGTLGGCPSSSWKGGGYRGLMRWRIPTECLHRQILIKNSSVSSFVSSSALWPFFLFISFFAEILSALIRHFFHFCFSCQGKNGPMWFRCSSSGEWGGEGGGIRISSPGLRSVA